MLLTAHAASWLFALALAAPGAGGAKAKPAEAPGPFDPFGDDDIQQVVHPGQAKPAAVMETSLWKGEGTPRLLVRFDRQPKSEQSWESTYEIAMLGLEKDALTLLARYVETDHWDDCHGFDLAPYRVTKDRTAIGVKYQRGMGQRTGVFLKLYLRTGATFQPIFEEAVESVSNDGEGDTALATIQMAPGPGEYRDLVVVSDHNRRQRWTWDAAAQAYREATK